MEAIRITAYGGPEVLRSDDVPVPEPGPGQARVRVEAAGINFIDVYHRTGQYPGQLPFTPGVEAAGVVDAIGPGVSEVRPGDRVVYAGDKGSYAEYAIVSAAKLAPIPASIDSQRAAALMLQGITAHYLSHSTYPLNDGDTALVHAAAGGVGQLLVQMAKLRGARVIGTVSTEEKARLARELGADAVILYTQVNFEEEVKRLTDGQGVEVVYDSVGKDTFEQSLNCLRLRGYMVLYGQSSGAVPPINPQVLNSKGSLFLTRPTSAHYTRTREELLKRAQDLFTWLGSGVLKVCIDRALPLAQAAEAHRLLESRQTMGKLLLIPGAAARD